MDIDINVDRENHNKKFLKPRKPKKATKQIKKSTTNPDSGYMMRDNKPGLMSIFWTQKVKLFYAALLANNSH